MANVARMIELKNLRFADNVRTAECMAIPAIVESFRRHGFKVNHPLVVSEKPGDDGATFLVLCGNRRGIGLNWLQEHDSETLTQVLPNGKVPAIVHKGLTREEETDLRIDHSADEDRVPLDEWSIYLAIKQLVQSRIDTQERIAVKLGLLKKTGKNAGKPQREYVQSRTNLVRLPAFVEEEYRKLTLDKESTNVRWNQVPTLYKLFNKEYVEHGENGPEFQTYWTKITSPPEVIPSDAPDPKELTPSDAVKRSQSASSAGLKAALLIVTKQSAEDLADVDARLVAAESALRILGDVKAYLGEREFAEMVDAATKQANDQRQAKVSADEAAAEHAMTGN